MSERKFLRLLAKGKTDEEIAVEIGGIERQISEQRRRLIERLRIRSQAQLAAAAGQPAAWPTVLDRAASNLRTDGDKNRSNRRPHTARQYWY